MIVRFFTVIFIFLLGVPMYAAVIYTEAESGDLNNIIENPSDVGEFDLGANMVIGTINEGGVFTNGDVFTFTVAPNHILTSLVFEFDSNAESHFLGLHDESIPYDPDDLLFATLVTNEQNGVNILSEETGGGSFDGAGYELPLSSGDYTLWFQETSANEVNYSFTFTTVAIPEPSSSVLFLLSSVFLFRRSRGLNGFNGITHW